MINIILLFFEIMLLSINFLKEVCKNIFFINWNMEITFCDIERIDNISETYKGEIILLHDESWNTQYGNLPMLYFNKFFIYENITDVQIFYYSNDGMYCEVKKGSLKVNNKAYDFLLILLYQDEVYFDLKKNNLRLVLNNLDKLRIFPFGPVEFMDASISPKLIQEDALKCYSNWMIERGKKTNHGVFLISSIDYKEGEVWSVIPKSEKWIDLMTKKRKILEMENKKLIIYGDNIYASNREQRIVGRKLDDLKLEGDTIEGIFLEKVNKNKAFIHKK